LLSIAGGKLTTWRKMAEDLFELVTEYKLLLDISKTKGFSKQKFLIGLDQEEWQNSIKNSVNMVEDKVAHHIYQQYGRGAIEIIKLIEKEPNLSERIVEENNFIKAEIIYVLRHELTTHLIDVFCRRTEMSMFIDHRKQFDAAKKVADIMAEEYRWDENKKEQEIKDYTEYIEKTTEFI